MSLFDPITAAISAGANAGLAAKQFEYNTKLAAQQNQYNIDMWRMNNEYNTPQAQMQRFIDAGLNPNLIYGQGTAGNSSAPPQQVVPDAPDYSHIMSDISKMDLLFGLANKIEDLRARRLENRIREDKHDNLQQDWIKRSLANSWEQERQEAIRDKYNTLTPDYQSNGASIYFQQLYDLNLQKILKNNLLTDARNKLYRTQETLNNLQSNFYRVRNAWQPWQYGFDMLTDGMSSLVPWFKFGKMSQVYNKKYKLK